MIANIRSACAAMYVAMNAKPEWGITESGRNASRAIIASLPKNSSPPTVPTVPSPVAKIAIAVRHAPYTTTGITRAPAFGAQ